MTTAYSNFSVRAKKIIATEELVTADIQLSDTSWDDLKFPVNATKALAGKEPGTEADTGLLLFNKSADEGVTALAQMPHSWAEGTSIKPHIHWQKTTSAAGNVYWQLEYKISAIGAVMDENWTTLFETSPVAGTPDNETANEHLITAFDTIDMTGYELSDCILLKISRVGGEATDTYGADARMLEFDLHYQIDSFGSDEEFHQSAS